MMDSPTEMKLEFEDFVDLQTRLVLLPRIQDEGMEAVVAMYTPRPEHDSIAEDKGDSENSIVEMEETPSNYAGDEEENESTADSVDAKKALNENENSTLREETDPSEANPEAPNDPVKEDTPDGDDPVVGMVLVGVTTKQQSDVFDCREIDFATILSTIREAPTPIVLVFERIQQEEVENVPVDTEKSTGEQESSPEDDASTSTSATPEERDVEEEEVSSPKAQSSPQPTTTTTNGNEWSDRFSSWGSRVRATSATLAAEAASSAASLAAAANEAAERAKANRLAAASLDNALDAVAEKASDGPKCGMFVQCSAGKFVPLQPPSAGSSSSSLNSASSSPKVTTSSILLIRESVHEPCPSRGYSYQWYRSYRPATSSDGSISEISKDGSKDGSNDGTSAAEDASVVSESTLEWTPLVGAVFATYQPSATDVGHYLRCVVTIDSLNVNDDGSHVDEEETVVCSTCGIVAADTALFSGATTALTRGAKFGNLAGRGNAEGRLFRCHVEISRCNSNEESSSNSKLQVTSAVTIFQISSNTAEPLHEEPILHVSAVSDPSRPKDFELVLPSTNVPAMVAALSTNGRFQLQAPNRITRESLLLALGIANYKGKPINLNAKTALYPGRLDDATNLSSPIGGAAGTPTKRLVGEEVEFFTPQEESRCPRSPTFGSDMEASPCDRAKQLEHEFQRLRSKMSRKDKVIADLQRQLTQSDAKVEKMEKALSASHVEAEARKKEIQDCRSLIRLADRRNETHNDTIRRLKGDHEKHVSALDNQVSSQAERIAELEKSVRTLQNEKAVLSAAVEARDSKLSKMGHLQTAVDSLSQKVSKGDSLKTELNDMSQRYIKITQEMEKVSNFEKECREELEQTRSAMEDLQKRLAQEKQKGGSRQSGLETLQVKNEKLQAERNSYKQKADSLSKEVGRLCRNGRTLRDIEKIIADEESRQMEVSLLKQQKRQALEDLHHYRTAYEQTVVAQKQAGLDVEAVRALEQKAELERVVSDMTEYLNAKEMQLETLKEVNQALSEELHQLARAGMGKNDI